MRFTRYTIISTLLLTICQLSLPVFGQLGVPISIEKPKEYEERVLRSERSDEKKFTVPRRFIQNTVSHYNYYFNANNKLNEVLERAKTAFKDDYSQLLPFYNYSLDVTAKDSIQLDSVIYKSSTGIALHDLRSDWADNLYLLWGAAFYLQKKFDSAYLMFQFINYAFAPKEKDGYYRTIGSGRDGNSAFSISTKEKRNLPRKLFSQPPSRNDAFIWQIRNFLVQDQFAEAGSLISMLKQDPFFPERLDNDLHEVQALFFYKRQVWDSAAFHLADALSNATNQQEKARWEYLAAQLFELSANYTDAEKYYSKASTHTTDLIMDIYAKLASVRVNKDEGENTIEKNVAELLKMARRDKYVEYRDIIYYMAAQMQLEAGNTDAALALLLKSTLYPGNDPSQRNKAFLQLAELSFSKKLYRQAYNFYDSLSLDDPSLKDAEAIIIRKNALGVLANNIEIIERQDSLQRIAKMPEDERKDFVKKLAKQLRKQQGLKDDGSAAGSSIIPTNPDLFIAGGNKKGEWYFYNTDSRSRGLADFKSKWGNRVNADNWRRSAALNAGLVVTQNKANMLQGQNDSSGAASQANTEITFEGLYSNLPLGPEQMDVSNDSIATAMFMLGKTYIQQIEDCSAGTETLEQLRARFPVFENMDEVLFNLYYCYNKNGETAKADAIKRIMKENFGDSNFTIIVTTGKNPQSTESNPDATKIYEDIYDLFIEGKFEQAIAQKKIADARYGKNFWTSRLLYIEAVYYIQQRQDSIAKNVLHSIINQFPGTPLAIKATNLLDVLGRRKQIEEELKNLVVTRNEDSTSRQPVVTPVVVNPAKSVLDSSGKKQPPPAPVVSRPNPAPNDSTTTQPVKKLNTAYTFLANTPHYVVLVLTKVDPVFSNEAKNAFFRYNRETYYNKTFTLELYTLNDENRLLLTAPFSTADEAIAYIDKAQPKTASEIIPWLKGGKYSYIIISQDNLEVLKNLQDIDAYKQFLNQHFPGKF